MEKAEYELYSQFAYSATKKYDNKYLFYWKSLKP